MNLNSERLERLAQVTEHLNRAVFTKETQDVLEQICEDTAKLLGAESCAFFEYLEGAKRNFCLKATWCKQLGKSREGLKLEFDERTGMTGFLATVLKTQNEPIVYTRGEYLHQLHNRGFKESPTSKHPHVEAGVYHSLLAVGLKRKNRLRGFLKILNKRESGGNLVDFDVTDVLLGTILAVKLSSIYENRLILSTLLKLSSSRDINVYYRQLLDSAAHLLMANRGELALWDEDQRQLIYHMLYGDHSSELIGSNMPVPKESVIRSLWQPMDEVSKLFKQDEVVIINNVSDLPKTEYHIGHSATHSEAAIRINGDPLPLGVLNVEADEAGHFDEHDKYILRLLVQTGASLAQELRNAVYFQKIVRKVMTSDDPLQNIFEQILDHIHAVFGFEEGIIYQHDPKTKRLKPTACRSNKRTSDDARNDFQHTADGASFAAHVFNKSETEDPFDYSEDPWNDEDRVSKEGLKYFDIHSPLLGLQIRFGGRPMGALILWSRENPPPQRHHAAKLLPYSELISSKITLNSSIEYIKRSEHFYQDMLQNLPVKVFRKRLRNRNELEFVFVNKAFADEIEMSPDDIIGRTDYDIYGKESELANKYQSDDLTVIRNRSSIDHNEKHAVHGIESEVRVIKIRIADANDENEGVLGCFWDTTKERQVEDQWRAELNHRLASALARIIAKLLKSRGMLLPDECAAEINACGQFVDKLYSHHNLVFRPGPAKDVNYSSFSDRIHQIFRLLLEFSDLAESKIRFVITPPAAMALSEKEQNYLTLIFNELITNSLRHAQYEINQGFIRISCQLTTGAERRVTWEYSDNGRSQYGGAYRDERNSGEGLTIVNKFIELLGGSIPEQNNKAQGPDYQGWRFTFSHKLDLELRP